MSDYDSLIGEARVAARLTANGYERDVLNRLADALEAAEAELVAQRGFVESFRRFYESEKAATDEARRIAEAQRIKLYGAQFLAYPLPWESPSEGGN